MSNCQQVTTKLSVFLQGSSVYDFIIHNVIYIFFFCSASWLCSKITAIKGQPGRNLDHKLYFSHKLYGHGRKLLQSLLHYWFHCRWPSNYGRLHGPYSGTQVRNECVTFHTVKSHFPLRPRPGVIITKDKKTYERQRSVLKATEIKCFLFFFPFQKFLSNTQQWR